MYIVYKASNMFYKDLKTLFASVANQNDFDKKHIDKIESTILRYSYLRDVFKIFANKIKKKLSYA